jgi:hypothetical protein
MALNPHHVEPCINRGIVLHELKRFDETLASFDKAIELKPALPGRQQKFDISGGRRRPLHSPDPSSGQAYEGNRSSVVHNDLTGADQTPHFDLHGGIIGVTTGLNIQNRNLVYGYESDTSYSGARGSTSPFTSLAAEPVLVSRRDALSPRGCKSVLHGEHRL